ncbi:MAG: hypothetical protein ABIO44_11275, partial [Saprospiraceae bacterium]
HNRSIKLLQLCHLIDNNNTIEILSKGFTLSLQKNKRIRTKKDIDNSIPLTTIFVDGSILSTITKS